mmetsp:Transcript_49546/g.112474  ORF Transcript_49546/g.112474 Transcript_49546/m.112474 type:complete len:214 (-) Transcript_49546:394-1035(-)
MRRPARESHVQQGVSRWRAPRHRDLPHRLQLHGLRGRYAVQDRRRGVPARGDGRRHLGGDHPALRRQARRRERLRRPRRRQGGGRRPAARARGAHVQPPRVHAGGGEHRGHQGPPPSPRSGAYLHAAPGHQALGARPRGGRGGGPRATAPGPAPRLRLPVPGQRRVRVRDRRGPALPPAGAQGVPGVRARGDAPHRADHGGSARPARIFVQPM